VTWPDDLYSGDFDVGEYSGFGAGVGVGADRALSQGDTLGQGRGLGAGGRYAPTRGALSEAGLLRQGQGAAGLGWAPRWDLGRALTATAAWYQAERAGANMRAVTLAQIEQFQESGE